MKDEKDFREDSSFRNPNVARGFKKKLCYDDTITIPKDGKVLIPFPESFLWVPSCSFEGGTLPGEHPIVTTESAIIKAMPDESMHYTCTGIKKEEEVPWKFIGFEQNK